MTRETTNTDDVIAGLNDAFVDAAMRGEMLPVLGAARKRIIELETKVAACERVIDGDNRENILPFRHRTAG